jgi:hypothetical protein
VLTAEAVVGTDLKFTTNRLRSVAQSDSSSELPELGGLVELMDNNPLVCADHAWVPDATTTLLLAAFGPIALSGLVLEAPSVLTNAPISPEAIERGLDSIGWTQGVTLAAVPDDMGDVYALTCLAKVSQPEEWDELDDIYEERYQKALYIRRDESSEWTPELVRGKNEIIYRLRLTLGEGEGLLSIMVLGDRNGKCGPKSAIHMMNVMCGFEESLGID